MSGGMLSNGFPTYSEAGCLEVNVAWLDAVENVT